jgi:phage terminase large subunit-like protein
MQTSSSTSSSDKRLRARARRFKTRYYFDAEAAERPIEFIETFCHHSKGEWQGHPLRLEEHQKRVIRAAFGWKHKTTGLRVIRQVYTKIPRKNGKSTEAAAIALYLLFADQEPGAEIYGYASDGPQAELIFTEATRMVEASPDLDERAQIFRGKVKCILVPSTLSSYQVLTKQSKNKDGLNPHGLVGDEIHELTDHDLYDKLISAAGSRRQPMHWQCTTAGVKDKGDTVYERVDQYAHRVASGEIEDDSFLPVLYELPPDADVSDRKNWALVNPNLGVSLYPERLEEAFRRAQNSPREMAVFKRYHLNIDTKATVGWLRQDKWDACRRRFGMKALWGRRCYLGLDLSSRTDMTSVCAAFRIGLRCHLIWHYWIPLEGILQREKHDQQPYRQWVKQGWLTATDGDVIDFASIESKLDEWARLFEVVELAFDPWAGQQLSQRMADGGMEVVEFGQGIKNMSEPAKKFEELMLTGRLRHGGNPIAKWNSSVVEVRVDADENIKPVKPGRGPEKARIDGIISGIMAVGRAYAEEDPGSVYDNQGLDVIE